MTNKVKNTAKNLFFDIAYNAFLAQKYWNVM